MLAGWTDSHTTGAKVTFWLPDQDALEAFRHLTVRKGRTAGQRFMAVLIQIGDDEQPIDPGSDTKPVKRNNALALSAVQVCKDSTFHEFVAGAVGYLPASQAEREEVAAEYVRDYCRIESRAELDQSPTAAQLFARLMAEYRDWRVATGATA
jgi:hypothetical protein